MTPRSMPELVQAFRYNNVLQAREQEALRQLAEAIMTAATQGWPDHQPPSTTDLDL